MALIPEDVELSLLEDVDAVELVVVELETASFSSVVRAFCAPEMSSLERAVETLERNVPSALSESAFDGVNFSTSANFVFASAVSPDLMEDIRPESALSKLFCELLEVLETEDAESSERRELVLCTLEISMNSDPFPSRFLRATAAVGQ
jgi:hypothetical protein